MGNKKLLEAAEDAMGTLEAIELYGTNELRPGVLEATINRLHAAIRKAKSSVSQRKKRVTK